MKNTQNTVTNEPLTWENIPRLVDQLVEYWKAKHPNYKPSHYGTKLTHDDQWDYLHYGDVESCTSVHLTEGGMRVMQPDARVIPRPIFLDEQDALRRLYDERTL